MQHQKIKNYLNSFYSRKIIPINQNTIIINIFLIILTFILNFIIRLNNTNYLEKDDYIYFSVIEKIFESDNFLESTFKYAKNTFIYFLSITPFFEHSINYFNFIRYINLIYGILMILAVYFSGKYLFSKRTGLISAFLISINPNILERLVLIAPENLLVLFSTLSLLFFVIGFKKHFYFFIGFIFSVAAAMTKSNGISLLIAFILSTLIILIYSLKKKEKQSYLIFYIIILIFSILLIEFWKILYNIFDEHAIKILKLNKIFWDLTERYGINNKSIYSKTKEINFYFIIHSLSLGFLKEAHRYAVSFFTSIEWRTNHYYIGSLGYIIVPMYFYLLTFEKNFYRKILYISFSAISYLITVPRNAVDHGTARYTIMIAPLFYYFISPFLIHFYLWFKNKLKFLFNFNKNHFIEILLKMKIIKYFFYSLPFVIILGLNLIFYPNILYNFSIKSHLFNEYKKALEWIKNNSENNDVIILSSTSRLGFKWYIPKIKEIRTSITRFGKDISDIEIINFLKSVNAKFIVLDTKLSYSPYNKLDHRYFFRSKISYKNNSFKVIKKLPKEIKIKAQFSKKNSKIIILEFKP